MARLENGKREERRNLIHRLLQRHRFGLRESEIAQETGLHRRTVNNYLRELRDNEKINKEGRLWFANRRRK